MKMCDKGYNFYSTAGAHYLSCGQINTITITKKGSRDIPSSHSSPHSHLVACKPLPFHSSPRKPPSFPQSGAIPQYLHESELLVGLSGCYRHFIARYAAIIEPLQSLKTRPLKGS